MRALHAFVAFPTLLLALAQMGCAADSSNAGSADQTTDPGPTESSVAALTDVTLANGQHRSFGTWSFWGVTNVAFFNMDELHDVHVSLQVGLNGPEWVTVPHASRMYCAAPLFECQRLGIPPTGFVVPGTIHIQRQWAGFPVNITNHGPASVEVHVW